MKATLAMAIHFHQPVGNFDHVIERACDKCYIPFIDTLKAYPGIKMTFHFTGCLLEWAEEHRPEMIEKISDLVSSGQVEMMTGGFYEPILVSIPEGDRTRQINMLTEYVKDTFAYEPKGAWVAERVWEPSLASTFHSSGVKYIILDDTHFLYAGVSKDKTHGYYVTEDNGKPVAVFPSDKVLRYHMPFKMPADCIGYIRSVAEREDSPLLVYGDDGEKFGEWPGTHKWVFEEKWLENFFNELSANSGWIETAKMSDCLANTPSKGRIYLPTASYEEMLEWSLPADMQEYMEDVVGDIKNLGKEEYYKPFVRGGFWRNFLTKYPESNHMNKKMLYVSGKVDAIRASSKDKDSLEQAEKELFRGQCNCAYWHGVFGGLYLYHLRNAIYEHLIRSEGIIDRMQYGDKDFLNVETTDMDADGSDGVVMENRYVSLYIMPSSGGTLRELDSKQACQNLINSLTRRKEAYHRQILKKIGEQERGSKNKEGVKTIHDGIQVADASLKDCLNYDWYPRHALIDHFLDKGAELGPFSRCEYDEKGDFVLEEYSHKIEKEKGKAELVMTRDGMVDGLSIRLSKTVTLTSGNAGFGVKYVISNLEEKTSASFVFAPEFNLTMPHADSERYQLVFDGKEKPKKLDAPREEKSSGKVSINDTEGYISFNMALSRKCPIWAFPVKTVSQSEKAYELNYQSTAIVPRFEIDLKPGESEEVTLDIEVVTHDA